MTTKSKKKKIYEANGIIFDSNEELEFYYWLVEAVNDMFIAGFIYHPFTFELAKKKTYQVEVTNKRGTRTLEKHLLNNCEYTPDFKITPGRYFSALKTGWHIASDNNYWIDTKGTFARFNDARYFSVMQKWMYDATGIYINKVIPKLLFKKTFVPAAVAYNLNGSRRKPYADCRFIEEILEV